ncbi:MAG TPA: hypothetical protein VG797_02165 [Phycisphaerales bacterium]|nr:hypothetical protein [Phycisphaerales bacterium]
MVHDVASDVSAVESPKANAVILTPQFVACNVKRRDDLFYSQLVISGQSIRGPLLTILPLAVFAVGLWATGAISNVLGTAFGCACVAAFVGGFGYILFGPAIRRRKFKSHYPFELDFRHRVHVIAEPERLAKLERLRDEFFEPIIIPLAMATIGPAAWRMGTRMSQQRRVVHGAIQAGIILVVLAPVIVMLVYKISLFAVGPFAMALFAAATVLLTPAYLRFTPGRVAVIVYPPLGIGTPSTQEFDLRHKAVLIDRYGVMIGDGESAVRVEWTRPAARSIDERLDGRPIEAAVRAAISTHESPRIPEGELIG